MALIRFNTPVYFGYGERAQLPALMRLQGMQRPLFVTDKGVVAAGVFAMATEALGVIDSARVFDATPPNPTEDAAEAGYALYRAQNCDGVVGIGGGAAIDLAKAIAVLCADPAPLWEFCNRHAQPRAIVDPPPVLALPTTAGSGAEVGRSAVMIFRNGIKAGIGCPSMVRAAICDPELTLGLPPYMTAASGMDALSHCVETYCSPATNPPADAIALDGLQRLYAHIARATANGGDRDARWQMMMGAMQGALCFQKGMGAVHSLSHAAGALGHHHGTLNAIFLPHVLAYNAPSLGEKLPALRGAMGLRAAEEPAAALATLNTRLGLPAGLKALGIAADSLSAIAQAALADNAHKTNPRPLAYEDYMSLLRAAYV